jgi:DNA helicase-2/ATP-dependent DNA helicase PcrA
MSRTWSPYQQAIYSFLETGTGNAIVEAVAGSGKTTTIVEASQRIPRGKTSILLAFNKTIADELKSRGVNARTFHSLTYGPVMSSRKINNVETNKLRMLCKQIFSSDDAFVYSAFISKLVGLARNAGIGCLVADKEDAWWTLIEHHDLELENERGNMHTAIEYARTLLEESCLSNYVDFDDMLYFAVKDGIALPKFDYVFVDEAQDTNAIQRAIIRKICHPETRVVFVGDPAQAIYGFRGADSDSMKLLAEEFDCERLPLTISYRCPASVIAEAHKYVKHIEAAPDAPVGNVYRVKSLKQVLANTAALCNGTSTEQTPETPEDRCFTPRDLVVCRTTKPLISLAFKAMRQRIPVKIMGREIGQGLKTLIGKMRANNVDDLVDKLEAWAAREIDKAIAKQLDAKVDQLQDKLDAILCLVEGLPETARTIPDLLECIEGLFNNNVQALTLGTIHKVKGMEADRVWWLNASQCPSKWAKQPWQKAQEIHLCYVAITRAKVALLYVEDDSNKNGPTDDWEPAAEQAQFANSPREDIPETV